MLVPVLMNGPRQYSGVELSLSVDVGDDVSPNVDVCRQPVQEQDGVALALTGFDVMDRVVAQCNELGFKGKVGRNVPLDGLVFASINALSRKELDPKPARREEQGHVVSHSHPIVF